jgi:hypothetical protein
LSYGLAFGPAGLEPATHELKEVTLIFTTGKSSSLSPCSKPLHGDLDTYFIFVPVACGSARKPASPQVLSSRDASGWKEKLCA